MRMVPTTDKHVNMLKKLENDHPIVSTAYYNEWEMLKSLIQFCKYECDLV